MSVDALESKFIRPGSYRIKMRKTIASVECPDCKQTVDSNQYESHCKEHGLNPKKCCVWCFGEKQWEGGKKHMHEDHILTCWSRCMFPNSPPPRIFKLFQMSESSPIRLWSSFQSQSFQIQPPAMPRKRQSSSSPRPPTSRLRSPDPLPSTFDETRPSSPPYQSRSANRRSPESPCGFRPIQRTTTPRRTPSTQPPGRSHETPGLSQSTLRPQQQWCAPGLSQSTLHPQQPPALRPSQPTVFQVQSSATGLTSQCLFYQQQQQQPALRPFQPAPLTSPNFFQVQTPIYQVQPSPPVQSVHFPELTTLLPLQQLSPLREQQSPRQKQQQQQPVLFQLQPPPPFQVQQSAPCQSPRVQSTFDPSEPSVYSRSSPPRLSRWNSSELGSSPKANEKPDTKPVKRTYSDPPKLQKAPGRRGKPKGRKKRKTLTDVEKNKNCLNQA